MFKVADVVPSVAVAVTLLSSPVFLTPSPSVILTTVFSPVYATLKLASDGAAFA